MQLVEQGKLSLDKPVYDILPELKDVKCLDEQGKLVPRKGDIVGLQRCRRRCENKQLTEGRP